MTHPNPSTAMARVMVDELARGGVRTVVVSPGSRSAALVIASSENTAIDERVVIDERSAAFHALGVAKATTSPAVVVSTSGTAPANFFPAVIEAEMSCVPLIVMSADRPAELRGVGANQTIDQVGLFGSHVRHFEDVPAPNPGTDENTAWRTAIRAALRAATEGRPGPVHVNVAFREPTVPVSDDGRSQALPYESPTPPIDRQAEQPPDLPTVGWPVGTPGERGVIVAGDGEYDRDQLFARAEELGWPLLATALSGLRGRPVVSTYHHLLSGGAPADLRPGTVVTVGSTGPSRSIERLVAAADHRIRIDRWGRVIDPLRNATHRLHGDVLQLLKDAPGEQGSDWWERWLEADAKARSGIDRALDEPGPMTGGRVARALNQVGWERLVVASSLPIREVDAHLLRTGPVFANRGASGIDGFVSTAFGVASVGPGTVALAGDLSLLHDSNGFLHDAAVELTIVVLDNGGGGLFDGLPPARHAPSFDRLFVTPPNRDLEDLARFHKVGYREVTEMSMLLESAERSLGSGGVTIVRVPIDRRIDREQRDQLLS